MPEKIKACLLMGSPRKNGNTNSLLGPFLEELAQHNFAVDKFWLYDLKIAPCIACRVCQQDWQGFNCKFRDDAWPIFDSILVSDIIILASPIYCWYCTAPMKALLDRLMYGMNKYYGQERGPSLWAGKRVAIASTCGYEESKGPDLFEAGMRRYCKHSGLDYLGMLVERDMGYQTVFMDENKALNARRFAGQLAAHLKRA